MWAENIRVKRAAWWSVWTALSVLIDHGRLLNKDGDYQPREAKGTVVFVDGHPAQVAAGRNCIWSSRALSF